MTNTKLEKLSEKIASKGKILVAFSGGVDSGLLLRIAHDLLVENVLCVTLDAEVMPRSELNHAEKIVRELGCGYEVVKFPILANKNFVKNSKERCYYCKRESSKILKKIASDKGIECVADGVNQSDFDEHRPGIRASDEEGIWHPFVEVGITKSDIREIAKELGFRFWNKPSSACLATRIPYGEEVTRERLTRVERAEEFLKRRGFRQVRVRMHGEIARIEVMEEEFVQIFGLKAEIIKELKGMGFKYITIDLEGYRSGSMDGV